MGEMKRAKKLDFFWLSCWVVVGLFLRTVNGFSTTRICPQCALQRNETVSLEGFVEVTIPAGISPLSLASYLAQKGLLKHPWLFLLQVYWQGSWKHLQAGTYRFSKSMTPQQILEALRKGKVMVHKVTIPEGVTVSTVVRLLRQHPCLQGTIRTVPPEGSLLPGTYVFTLGTTREEMLQQMREALKKLWVGFTPQPQMPSPQSCLILASIVEKETRMSSEKERIASVFLTRLQKNMRLQADPTVIYGITLGLEKLGRPLTKADLKFDTPYNTYTRKGLPPTPICCPGRETVLAVMKARPGQELFFVTDGQGGHLFSSTLQIHNQHVAQMRQKTTKP